MQLGVHIDYKTLRAVNPEAARLAVLGYLDSCGHNVAETARTFGLTRVTVYALERKRRTGSLADRSRAPHHRPRHTPPAVEERVVAVRNQTHLGPKGLSLYLAKYEGLEIPRATIRHILRRRHQLAPPFGKRRPSAPRPFGDWYAAKPFEIVPMDLKYIRDHKALSRDQIAHLDRYGIPNFQWGALDDLLSLQADGLLPGASASGGYISRAFQLTSPQRLLEEATGYLYYYNNYNILREHSSLDYRTPFQTLKARLPQVDDRIRFIIPILLDTVAVQLGPSGSGYNVLAQHHVLVQ